MKPVQGKFICRIWTMDFKYIWTRSGWYMENARACPPARSLSYNYGMRKVEEAWKDVLGLTGSSVVREDIDKEERQIIQQNS
jgi:hypothetical protein